MPCPRTVLCTRLAERVGLASECQARERGSPRKPRASQRRLGRSQRGCPIHRQGSGRQVLGTPWCAKPPSSRTTRGLAAGASPDVSREAPGASALRPQVRRKRSIAQAVWRLRLSETARPSVGARRLRAFPWAGFCSKRLRSVWPWGVCRKQRGAAAEKAHVRGAWPIFVPEVPTRLPPDAVRHVTRRPSAAQACPRGTRSL